jgi:hypothetical protein
VAEASVGHVLTEADRIGGAIAERFEIRKRLGAGGFGTVYEAFDRERNTAVALKTMNHGDPRTIYRFKQEFRKLSELVHPHLVQLYELHSDGERWFFTMELVEGDDAHSHVWAQATFDEAKARTLFRQLAEALCFLHESGRLHRDIKPSNVVVAAATEAWPHGRAVLVDFGLVADIDLTDGEAPIGAVAGTPQYMAPEQAAGLAVGPAADWYAVGVMLYKALTGRLPFDISPADCLRDERESDPPPPAALATAVPEDLNQLCIELLDRSPARRPSGREVLRRLSAGDGESSGSIATSRPKEEVRRGPPVLVGRAAHQQLLRDAFAATREGRAVAALMQGPSGMGKSALALRFIDELRVDPARPLVLAGRCFEQESVPYKALDSIVDALGHHLGRMPVAEVDAVLPRDVAALARLFPVLRQVRAVDEAPRRSEGAGKLELRRRAFGALRELFARIASRRPLVVFIDDLQWGDADSGALLAQLLAPPDAPAMLLLLAYRSDEPERNECLRALLPSLRAAGPLVVCEVEVGRLGDEEARELALRALADRGTAARAAAIARESGGWPFFIRELARFSEERTDPAARAEAPLLLARMLGDRVAALPDEARRLLEVIAIAGQPIERAIAARAAGIVRDEPSLLGLLRRERLLRALGEGRSGEIEAYHDRIRETVIAGLAPDARRLHHRRLASVLEATGRADAETLATHFQGAGETAKAIDYLIAAADRALEALGFDRSARCYRHALDLLEPGDLRRCAVQEKLGDALVNAGRSAEGAAAYLDAVAGASSERAFGLRRRAAEHYLVSGHVDEGIEVLRAVLAATGLSMPTTPLGVLVRLVPLLLLLWWRGLRYREHPAAEVPVRDLLRIDACAALRTGLGNADPLQAFYFQKRFLWLALRAGEPHRVLRALNYEAAVRASLGRELPSRFEERLRLRAHSLVKRLGDSGIQFRTEHAMALTLRCRFAEARTELEGAEEQLRESSAGMTNELPICRFYLIQALYHLGEWRELVRRQIDFLEHARARGDLSLEANLLSLTGHVPGLMADHPEAARTEVERAATLWARPNQFQQYTRLVALGGIALYAEAGRGGAALRLCAERWPALVRSRLMRLSWAVRVQCLFLHGGALLAAAACAPPGRRGALLGAVDRDARALGRIDARVAQACAVTLRAGASAGRGDRERADRLLNDGEARFDALDMALYAAAARRRRGELRGGMEGSDLTASADAIMSAQNIRDPARTATMFVPGAWT